MMRPSWYMIRERSHRVEHVSQFCMGMIIFPETATDAASVSRKSTYLLGIVCSSLMMWKINFWT